MFKALEYFGFKGAKCITWIKLLPPANEVWCKIMFYTCVSFCSGGGGWLPSVHHRSHDHGVCIHGVCIQWGLHPGRVRQIPLGILRDTVNKCNAALHILLECIHVLKRISSVYLERWVRRNHQYSVILVKSELSSSVNS